jgi:hypothetical protein
MRDGFFPRQRPLCRAQLPALGAYRRTTVPRFLPIDRVVLSFRLGSIQIDGKSYGHDVVIEGREVRKRKKKPPKPFRDSSGHTPLSNAEDIPWKCRRLVVGTGANGALPVMEDVRREAQARHVECLVLPTTEAIRVLAERSEDANAILHATC